VTWRWGGGGGWIAPENDLNESLHPAYFQKKGPPLGVRCQGELGGNGDDAQSTVVFGKVRGKGKNARAWSCMRLRLPKAAVKLTGQTSGGNNQNWRNQRKRDGEAVLNISALAERESSRDLRQSRAQRVRNEDKIGETFLYKTHS